MEIGRVRLLASGSLYLRIPVIQAIEILCAALRSILKLTKLL